MHGVVLDREQVHEATLRLPKRQRQALTRFEDERLSYEEIAAAMETSRGAVAQLIARARINLYDELRGTPLASVVPSAECERALPLIAAREDGQLEGGLGGEEATWLDAHLAGCERCRLAVEQMGEAAVAYRAPEAASAVVPPRERSLRPEADRRRSRRRRGVALAVAAAALLAGGALAALGRDDGAQAPALRASDAAIGIGAARALPSADRRSTESVGGSSPAEPPMPAPTSPPSSSPESGSGAGTTPAASGSPGKAAVQPKQPTSAPVSHAKQPSAAKTSQPAAPPTSEPAPQAPPPVEETTAVEEISQEHGHGHSGEPPGHSADHPPHR